MVHAMGTLRTYAFVTRRDDSEVYDMHRLVHLATKVWLGERGATNELNRRWPPTLQRFFRLMTMPISLFGENTSLMLFSVSETLVR